MEEKLSSMFHGVTVKAGNDANVAALGEAWKGGGKDYDDVVMITLGTGVGGGVIIGNNILTGYNGGAGEIGLSTTSIFSFSLKPLSTHSHCTSSKTTRQSFGITPSIIFDSPMKFATNLFCGSL